MDRRRGVAIALSEIGGLLAVSSQTLSSWEPAVSLQPRRLETARPC